MSSERIGYIISSGSLITSGITTTNMISTNHTTGTLVASSGITAGNINFTGSLYQNGALYSPSVSPVYGIYYVSNSGSFASGTTTVVGNSYFTPYTSMTGLSLGSTGWTNTSGSTLILQISYSIGCGSNNGLISVSLRNNSDNILLNSSLTTTNNNTYSASGIISLANNNLFYISITNQSPNSVTLNNCSYPSNATPSASSFLFVNVLH
jgi:hypothetical protein